jgi:ER lumen protein retaining receptor
MHQVRRGTSFVRYPSVRLSVHLCFRSIGISLRTHELFLFVFLTRFTDLFSIFHYSVYHFVFISLYIGITAAIVGTLRFRAPFQSPYDAVPYDRFPRWGYAVIPCALITWIINWLRGYFFHRNQEFWGMLVTFRLY